MPPSRRRWREEVSSPVRPSRLPLVGSARLPAKLPALNARAGHQVPNEPKLVNAKMAWRPDAQTSNDLEAAAALGAWLEGGKASAFRLLSGVTVLNDLKGQDLRVKKPQMAFGLLKTLASELLDAESHTACGMPRSVILQRLVGSLETSLMVSEELQRKVLQTASHCVATVEGNIRKERDELQAAQDAARVSQWHNGSAAPHLSAQETWTRRCGLSSWQGPPLRWTGAADTLSLVAASDVQRWHCAQLVEQARWSSQINSNMDAMSSAAYNMLGLAQELTAGFAVGWAFAFWRHQFMEDKTAAEQLQKMERSIMINREFLRIFVSEWRFLTVSLSMHQAFEEQKIKRLHLRVLAVRLRDAQDQRQECQQEADLDKSVHYMMMRKLQAAREDRNRMDYRLQTMPPEQARHALHILMEPFMSYLATFSQMERLICMQNMLAKDVLFLATDPLETAQDIVQKSCEEILCRWINCILMEAKHRASNLLTAGDTEHSRQNWAPADSQKFSRRCREIRTLNLLDPSAFAQDFQDGKMLTVLYAMLKSYRENHEFLDPLDLAAFDEKDNDRRAAAALINFSSLSPQLTQRFALSVGDIASGRLAPLKTALCAIFLREAPGIRSFLQQAAKDSLHVWEADRISGGEGKRRTMAISNSRNGFSRLTDVHQQVLELQYPMARIMHMFQRAAGDSAFAELMDLSRLCLPDEHLWSLGRLSVTELLLRWVNLQVAGSVTQEQVGNLASALASGHVLLQLLQTVAPIVLDAEQLSTEVEQCLSSPAKPQDKSAMKYAIRLAHRCAPFCFVSEDMFHFAQEDALTALVAGLFLCWPNLRREEESHFGHQLEGLEHVLEAGLSIVSTEVPLEESDLLQTYCACIDGQKLRKTYEAIEAQQNVMSSLQRRLWTYIEEVSLQRVTARLKFKGAGGDYEQTILCLHELVRDQDWVLLTEKEHAATRSSQPRSVVRDKMAVIAKLFDFYSIRGHSGERGDRQVHWSGIAQLYRDAVLFCPCMFLSKEAAHRIFLEVLEEEPVEEVLEDATPSRKLRRLAMSRSMETADSSWQDGGLGVSGFVRFLLRIAVHREESAGRAKAATVTLTRSLKELIGSHLQRAKCSEDDQFTMSLQTGKVQHLREIWEPLSRKIFQLYAEQGHVGEELRMGEDSLVLLLTDAGVLGGCLSEAGARQMCRSLLPRRHFRGGPRSFCFRGQAEVRRRRPRSPSLPAKVEGRQPYYAELGRPEGLYFEDFQEILLGLAMYHNPNLVVPIELRFEQFLMAMMEGLKRCILPLPDELDKAMPEHLKVQVNRAEEWDARQRAWDEMQEALQGCAEVPTEGWNKAEREARRRSFQATEGGAQEDTAAASLAERRSLSAPPGLSLRSRFQKVARKELAVVSAMASAASEASEGKAGLGHPAGHRLETMKSIMKAAKRLGTDINVAELQRKRAEVGRQAMQRRRSSAMVKVKFLADRRRSVEARASNVPSAAPSNQPSRAPSNMPSRAPSRASSFGDD
ncbi:unnamed protein product [Effrenium voratum]|nr:unnamed protein product [Effrenium voratum]